MKTIKTRKKEVQKLTKKLKEVQNLLRNINASSKQ
jgi:hypothetical protein